MRKLFVPVLSFALAAFVTSCGSDSTSDNNPAPSLSTAAEINTYLDGKTLLMEGANIPGFPNGYNENMNLGAATQCLHSTTIAVASGVWAVTSELGTLNDAPNLYDVGTCDNATIAGSPLQFSSTNVLIENVEGDGACFDITVTYPGFTQEGRGKFTDNGTMLTLELYFSGQATGHRCADGAVGANSVTLNGNAFDGSTAQQVYVIQ